MSDAQKLMESLTPEQKKLFLSALGMKSDVDQHSKPVTVPKVKRKTKSAPKKAVKAIKAVKTALVVITTQPVKRQQTGVTTIRPEGDPTQRRPVKFIGNQWKHDKRMSKRQITPPVVGGLAARNRPTPKIVEMECHVCHKKFTINENIVYGEFVRCNRCSGKR